MERQVSNRYRLIEPIGEGGMGVVWRAHDEVLDRTVAIKEVRYTGVGEAKRAELNQRTIREARAAGRLDHPSVIVIHDVVEEDGRPWIVMNLVQSRSLAEVIRQDGALPVARAAAIGAAVLDALVTAHAAGVLHRDVKPENVLLARDGRTVLTDFGIASLEAEQGLTATGGLVGTPAYMPPERLNGLPAGPESDLWSLGATLYTAVEGRAPFRGDSWAATVAAVLRDAPERPIRAGALAPVIEGFLRREPAARMDAREAAALLRGAQDEPVRQAAGHTRPGRLPSRATRELGKPRGRRLWITLSSVLLASGALGAGGLMVADRMAGSATEPPIATSPATKTASPGPSKSPSSSQSPIPDGWRMTGSEEGGFSVAVPKGWTAKKNPTRDSIAWTAPGHPGQLIVEWTQDKWLLATQHWQDVEKQILERGEFKGYERLGISAVTYRGWEAADWEFTRLKNGVRVHVIVRGFRGEGGRPYAVYWETTQARWARDREMFQTFVRYFRTR